MKNIVLYFSGLLLSIVLLTALILYIVRQKNKKQKIHYYLISMLTSALVVSLFTAADVCIHYRTGIEYYLLAAAGYIGLCGIPVFLFYAAVNFAETKIRIKLIHYLIWVIPAISLVIIWTNDYHHLFYAQYSTNFNEVVMGGYFYFYALYSYLTVFLAMFILIGFSVKNSSLFSRQSLLLVLAAAIPSIVNILYSFHIIPFSYPVTPLLFSFSVVCISIAILRFRFLNVMPIALQKVVNLISDAYVVINEHYDIIDFNKPITNIFEYNVKRNDNLIEILKKSQRFNINLDLLIASIRNAKKFERTVGYEKFFKIDNNIRYFTVEFSPVFSGRGFLGTIILLKEITQVKKYLNMIKKKQKELLTKERLSELGQLIGSISQSFSSPIDSVSAAAKRIKELASQYKQDLERNELPKDVHRVISTEIKAKTAEITEKCGQMIDILNSVKAQTILASTEKGEISDDLNKEKEENPQLIKITAHCSSSNS